MSTYTGYQVSKQRDGCLLLRWKTHPWCETTGPEETTSSFTGIIIEVVIARNLEVGIEDEGFFQASSAACLPDFLLQALIERRFADDFLTGNIHNTHTIKDIR